MTGLNLPVRVPLKPMLAKAVSGIPQPAAAAGGLAYEPKWDGFRCIVSRDGAGIELSSRGSGGSANGAPETGAPWDALETATPWDISLVLAAGQAKRRSKPRICGTSPGRAVIRYAAC